MNWWELRAAFCTCVHTFQPLNGLSAVSVCHPPLLRPDPDRRALTALRGCGTLLPMPDLTVDDMIDAALTGLPRGRRGAPSTPPTFLRDIRHEDLAMLAAPGAELAAARPIVKIRAQHHLAARLIAEGRKPVEVAAITGYTPARITQLRADPAFGELVCPLQGAGGCSLPRCSRSACSAWNYGN